MTTHPVAVAPNLGTAEAPLRDLLGRKRYVRVGGVHGASAGLLVAALVREAPALLVVTADARAADAVLLDAATFGGDRPLAFPTWPHDAGQGPPDADVLAARVAAIEVLRVARAGAAQRPPVLVAPIAALAQSVPSPAVVDAATLVLGMGETHPPEALLEHLALSGFVRVAAVESPGEFASHGGVVDVFPFGAVVPLRLDFFGDTLETVRDVDAATGRSAGARTRARGRGRAR